MDDYLKPYGDIELQRRMVSDRPRTNAFAAAIREVVQPGDVVLDVGTGTGILAMFAAKAGARKVYAIDATDIAEVATDLVKANGLSDQIQVLHGRAGELQLDQKVDLIISEWLGNAAFAEGMLHAVLDARDRNLTPTGRMLPSKVRVLIAPLDEPILYNTEGPGFWRERIHDLDFSSLQEVELSQGRTMQIRVEPAAVLAPGQAILELDLLTASVEDVWSERSTRVCSRPRRCAKRLLRMVRSGTLPECHTGHWTIQSGDPLGSDLHVLFTTTGASRRAGGGERRLLLRPGSGCRPPLSWTSV